MCPDACLGILISPSKSLDLFLGTPSPKSEVHKVFLHVSSFVLMLAAHF